MKRKLLLFLATACSIQLLQATVATADEPVILQDGTSVPEEYVTRTTPESEEKRAQRLLHKKIKREEKESERNIMAAFKKLSPSAQVIAAQFFGDPCYFCENFASKSKCKMAFLKDQAQHPFTEKSLQEANTLREEIKQHAKKFWGNEEDNLMRTSSFTLYKFFGEFYTNKE